jgi:hypothetical protein
MKGLFIKDLLNLKKSLTTIVVLIIFYLFIGFTSGEPSMLIVMISILCTMMTVTTISYDDLAKWDKYALAMPVSRRDLVLSKYILSFVLTSIGVGASTLIVNIVMNVRNSELLLTSYSIFTISLLFSSIILPLVFKFGVEKSRLMMMAVIGAPMALAYILSQLGIKMPDTDMIMDIIKFSPLITLVVIFISFKISYNIYKRKDI